MCGVGLALYTRRKSARPLWSLVISFLLKQELRIYMLRWTEAIHWLCAGIAPLTRHRFTLLQYLSHNKSIYFKLDKQKRFTGYTLA